MNGISFIATILKFSKKAEKTGWTYIEISPAQAQKLNPGVKVSFRIKGWLDNYPIQKTALLPMGEGNFILPLNGTMRKALRKGVGDRLKVQLQLDNRQPTPSADFLVCLRDEPKAFSFFKTLPKSHQNYFSKWIESAKTVPTKTKRITMAVIALGTRKGFPEMIRENKIKEREVL